MCNKENLHQKWFSLKRGRVQKRQFCWKFMDFCLWHCLTNPLMYQTGWRFSDFISNENVEAWLCNQIATFWLDSSVFILLFQLEDPFKQLKVFWNNINVSSFFHEIYTKRSLTFVAAFIFYIFLKYRKNIWKYNGFPGKAKVKKKKNFHNESIISFFPFYILTRIYYFLYKTSWV